MKSDFQAVILAAGYGSRLTDLTAKTPKSILPIGNLPMIWYPIRMLEKAGFEEAIVILLESQKDTILKCLSAKCEIRLKLDVVCIPGDKDFGSADSLRYIKDKIQCNLLVISSDLVMGDIPLHRIADVHRTYNATCTSLFSKQLSFFSDIQAPGPKTKRKAERDVVGVDFANQNRLLLLSSEVDFDEHINIRTSLLKRFPRLKVFTNLTDAHIYLFDHSVLDILSNQKGISTIKGELIPYLVKKQFEPTVQEGSPPVQNDDDVTDLESLAQRFSISTLPTTLQQRQTPALQCHLYLSDGGLAVRANNLANYVELNRQINRYWSCFHSPEDVAPLIHGSVQKSAKCQVSADTIIGSASLIGEKTAIKHSVIGSHCVVGNKCKIFSSVIMDYATIEDGCEITGSVISDNVHVGSDAKIKDSLVCSQQKVNSNAKLANESVIDEQRMMEI